MGVRGFVVEPRTVTRLPLQSTDHAKLSCTAAGHVVTTFLQLDHGRAIEAFLPAFLLGSIDELLGSRIFGAVSGQVSLVIADGTDLCAALFALAYLSAMLDCDMTRLNPFATVLTDAVDSVLGLVFEKLSIPVLLEVLVEQLVHVLQIDVIIRAAPWWHVSWISD
jgi:hypothetical protein